MTDPRDVVFKQESKHGRTIHSMKLKHDRKTDQTLWSGSSSKVQKAKANLAWTILCEQAEKLEELEKLVAHLNNPNLTLLEPIE